MKGKKKMKKRASNGHSNNNNEVAELKAQLKMMQEMMSKMMPLAVSQPSAPTPTPIRSKIKTSGASNMRVRGRDFKTVREGNEVAIYVKTEDGKEVPILRVPNRGGVPLRQDVQKVAIRLNQIAELNEVGEVVTDSLPILKPIR